MFLLFVFFAISIVFSFLCSIWEAVLLSVTPSYVHVEQEKGTSTGLKLAEFKENIDVPLSAILTLNTIAHTAGAIGVGSQAAKIWPSTTGATVVSVVMTLAILFLSEIIPKTIGANSWRSLAPFTVKSLGFIIKLLYPLVWVSQFITKKLKNEKDKSVLSRSDFAAMARVATQSGVIQEGESRILENLLKFNTVGTKSVMTPRTVVLAAREDEKIESFYKSNQNLRFSRIPIYKDSKDNITGFILKDDLLTALIQDKNDQTLNTIKREIPIVTENMPLLRLFDTLMEKRNHIALVVDEFGGMAGIVTMEDIIETLLGMEIVDEFDNREDMQAYARRKWEERAEKLGLLKDDMN